MANEIVTTAQDRMKQSLGSLQRDLGHIRAGRANASLLDRVQVVYYGAPTPL
ncbi:ribosome recycling factor, partial [Mycobacterium kansasii]